MKGWIGITDGDWYRFLRSHPELDEINFWRPKGGTSFRAIQPGEPFLFKLHAPDNYIVGGGYLSASGAMKDLPVSLAWECFGPGNGAASLAEMRRQISRYRGGAEDRYEDYKIGCIILNSPFYLDEDDWIPSPADLAPNVVQGKTRRPPAFRRRVRLGDPGLPVSRQPAAEGRLRQRGTLLSVRREGDLAAEAGGGASGPGGVGVARGYGVSGVNRDV